MITAITKMVRRTTFASCFIISIAQASLTYSVSVTGVSKKMTKKVTANLSLSDPDLQLNDESQLEWYATLGIDELNQAMKSYGYYHSTINQEFDSDKGIVHYYIEKGPQLIIADFSFTLIGEGNSDQYLIKKIQPFFLSDTQPYSTEAYDQAKNTIVDTVRGEGYAKASYHTQRVEINPDGNTAKVYLELDTGIKHFFGQTTFSESPLSDSLLNRYVPYYYGWPYTDASEQLLQSQLLQSDYFQSVIVDPDIQSDSQAVPISVNVKPNKPNRYDLGFGYGTDDGLRAKGAWHRRYINRWGHQFTSQAQATQLRNEVALSYKIPGKRAATDWYQIRAKHEYETYDEGIAKTLFTVAEQIKKIGEWTREIQFKGQREQYRELKNESITESYLFIPAVSYRVLRANNQFNPTDGYRLFWQARGIWTTDNNVFTQLIARHQYWHPPYPRGLLTSKVELGATLPSRTTDLPLSQRFYAGGSHSVRGYAFRSIGPRGTDGQGVESNTGGSHLATASLSFEHFFWPRIAIGPFFDIGNAMNGFHSGGFKSGAGLGMRYDTPVGPLQVSLASPLNDNRTNHVRLHVTIGAQF